MICETIESVKKLLCLNNTIVIGNQKDVEVFLEWSTWHIDKKIVVRICDSKELIEEVLKEFKNQSVLFLEDTYFDLRFDNSIYFVSDEVKKGFEEQYIITYNHAVSKLDKLDCFKNVNEFYIFGTGMVGKLLYRYIESRQLSSRMKGFIATKKNIDCLYSKPIYELESLVFDDTDFVFVAGAERNRSEMIDLLHSRVKYESIKQFDESSWMLFSTLKEDDYPGAIRNYYWRRTGKQLDLGKPVTYNEKIQWLKIYDRDPRKTILSDKYLVREWVKRTIGEEYLIPLVGAWDSFEEIDTVNLPKNFVIKLNNGCGRNIIINEENPFERNQVKTLIDNWTSRNFAFYGLELQYKDIPIKIIAEKDISCGEDLPDYKFFCFDGKVFCSYTMVDYSKNHSNGRLGFFDRDYKLMPYWRKDYLPITEQIEKPKNYEKMVEIAETLSRGFKHVRVDLYNLEGIIYFGEMTFSNADGLCQYSPDEFDYILGEQLTLNGK